VHSRHVAAMALGNVSQDGPTGGGLEDVGKHVEGSLVMN
jgi:hypothetical protein